MCYTSRQRENLFKEEKGNDSSEMLEASSLKPSFGPHHHDHDQNHDHLLGSVMIMMSESELAAASLALGLNRRRLCAASTS